MNSREGKDGDGTGRGLLGQAVQSAGRAWIRGSGGRGSAQRKKEREKGKMDVLVNSTNEEEKNQKDVGHCIYNVSGGG